MKKVKIGLIGAGNIANTHLESYKHLGDACEIVAICDINPERLKETADKFNIPNRYNTVDEMLAAHPDLDGADVCVWNCSHAECSIKALKAGINVLCEKPMAYSAKEAEEMIKARDESGKLLMIGFVCRFTDSGKIARDFIEKGYIGDVYYCRAQYVRRHGSPGGWFSDKSKSGGGPVIDLGVHVLDFTRYLAGSPKPVSVYAATFDNIGRRDYLKTNVGWKPKNASDSDPNTVEDFGTALIRYDNGMVTQLECSYSFNGEDKGVREIYGTKGGMDLSKNEAVKIWGEYNGFLTDFEVKTSNYKEGCPDIFDAEMKHFIDCINGDATLIATAEDGLEVMKILDAIYESARSGREVLL